MLRLISLTLLCCLLNFSSLANAGWFSFDLGGGNNTLSDEFKATVNPEGANPFFANAEMGFYGHATTNTVMGLLFSVSGGEYESTGSASEEITNKLTNANVFISISHSFGERYGSGLYFSIDPGLSFLQVSTSTVPTAGEPTSTKEDFQGPAGSLAIGYHVPFIGSSASFNIRVRYIQSWAKDHTVGTGLIQLGFGSGSPNGGGGM